MPSLVDEPMQRGIPIRKTLPSVQWFDYSRHRTEMGMRILTHWGSSILGRSPHTVEKEKLTGYKQQKVGEQELLDMLISHLVQQEIDDTILSIHGLIIQPICDVIENLRQPTSLCQSRVFKSHQIGTQSRSSLLILLWLGKLENFCKAYENHNCFRLGYVPGECEVRFHS